MIPGAPFHRSSLIGFNTTNGAKWFIVDPTYGQFYSNTAFYNYMIEKGMDVTISIVDADKVHVLGTPEELQIFLKEKM